MTYRIEGLDPARFAHLIDRPDVVLAGHGVQRVTVTTSPGFPCRVTLEDASPGETVLLLSHTSQPVGPFRSTHAIFVREQATQAATFVDRVPPVFAPRTLSLRGFDAQAMLIGAALAAPGDADPAIRAMLDNPAVQEIHVHNAAPGCFAAKVARA